MSLQRKERRLPPGAMVIAITVASVIITFLGLSTLLAMLLGKMLTGVTL